MIRKILFPFLFFCALAALEASLARWLPASVRIPLLLPVLVALAVHLPLQRLARLAFLGALAGELMSGLPQGIVFLLYMIIVPLVRIAVRRVDLPLAVHGLMGAVAAVLFIIGANGLGTAFALPPPRLLTAFVLAGILLPVLTTSFFVGLWSAVLHAVQQRRLRPLGFLPGIFVQRMPPAY